MAITRSKPFNTLAAAALSLAVLAGCSASDAALTGAAFSGPSGVFSSTPMAAHGEIIAEEDRLREAVVAHVPFNVSLWLRRDGERQFMVQRQDLQPMFQTDWSQIRAQSAVASAYTNECDGGALIFRQAVLDQTGVWVVDGVCAAPGATVAVEDLDPVNARFYAPVPRQRPAKRG